MTLFGFARTARIGEWAILTLLATIGVGISTHAWADDRMQVSESAVGKKPTPSSTSATSKTPIGTGPNPYLSFLPVGAKKDYEGWTKKLHAEAAVRRTNRIALLGTSGKAFQNIAVLESEPVGVLGVNDTIATAQDIPGLGTGIGSDSAADITGDLRTPPLPAALGPFAEDDGDIGKANATNMTDGEGVKVSATIGDGPFGSVPITERAIGPFDEDDGNLNVANVTSVVTGERVFTDGVTSTIGDGDHGSAGTGTGDIDVYSFTVDIAGPKNSQTVTLRVDNPLTDNSLDPILGLYDSAGTLLFSDDDSGGNSQSALTITFSCGDAPPCANTYYLAVAGYAPFATSDSFLTDPFDSTTGPGAGSEGPYVASIEMPVDRSGDFDFYAVDLVAGDTIVVDIDTPSPFGDLDPIIAVYSPAGTPTALNDDGDFTSFDSFLTYQALETGTHFIAVGGFNFANFPTTFASFPLDPFDSSSGPGAGSEGTYDITIYRNAADLDFFSFELAAGDIIGVNVAACSPCAEGEAPLIGFFAASEALLSGTSSDIGGIFPPSSPLPGGGNASLAYIVEEGGTYSVGVGFGFGSYDLELRLYRPPQEISGDKQILFLDFDGASIDTSIFGSTLDPMDQPTDLSPLSSFLTSWGLAAEDEGAVIDAILASVKESLDGDPRFNGANPQFDIELQNSRDHADPFPGSNVSRIIIGGTISESGIDTLGIAQSIDVGNWDQEETALVLLDLLSEMPSNPNSLNGFLLDAGSSIIDLIGIGVGNIIVHEAGHFFANFHTNNFNATPNLMDSGGNLSNLLGIGDDFIFGTSDDVDVDFGVDEFDPFESFVGVQDTLNTLAFGLSTGSAPPLSGASLAGDHNTNSNTDVGVLLWDSVANRNFVYIMDGGSAAQLARVAFGPEKALSHVSVPDMTGDNIPEHAVLVSGSLFARVKNPVTGALLGKPPFNAALDTVALLSVGDADGDSGEDLAVVGRDPVTGRVQVQVKRISNGSLVSRYNYAKDYKPVGVVVVDNIADSPANEIAVIGVDDAGRVRAQIKDARSGNLVNIVYFSKLFKPIAVAALPDTSGNLTYIAVLGRNASGTIRAQIKRASDSSLVSIVRFDDSFYPVSFLGSVDSNASGGGEVVVVGVDVDGKVRAQVKEIETATPLSIINFDPNYRPIEAILVTGVAGTGRSEIAVLGVDSGGQHRLQVKDLLTGVPVNNIFVP